MGREQHDEEPRRCCPACLLAQRATDARRLSSPATSIELSSMLTWSRLVQLSRRRDCRSAGTRFACRRHRRPGGEDRSRVEADAGPASAGTNRTVRARAIPGRRPSPGRPGAWTGPAPPRPANDGIHSSPRCIARRLRNDAQSRHTATSGCCPSRTTRSSGNDEPQHQHSRGSCIPRLWNPLTTSSAGRVRSPKPLPRREGVGAFPLSIWPHDR